MFLSDPFFNNFKEKCYIDGEGNKMELNDKYVEKWIYS